MQCLTAVFFPNSPRPLLIRNIALTESALSWKDPFLSSAEFALLSYISKEKYAEPHAWTRNSINSISCYG